MAIRIEENGEAVYRRAIENTSNPALASLLKWMADEEVKHAEWFMKLKQKVKETSKSPFVQEMGREFLKDIMGDQSFSLKDVDFSQLNDSDELLDIFVEFEKDSILFYEMIQPFVQDPDTRGQLNKIIEEEKRHIVQLRELAGKETPPDGDVE
jgi:rubrerythrin